jgi:hypothetical protein
VKAVVSEASAASQDWQTTPLSVLIELSLADSSGLILAARVGKHTDALIEALVVSTEGKTAGKRWHSADWEGYERILPSEILHSLGKNKTQRLEQTNGIYILASPGQSALTLALSRWEREQESIYALLHWERGWG